MTRKRKPQKKLQSKKAAISTNQPITNKVDSTQDPLLQQVKRDLFKTVVLACMLFVLEFAIFFVSVNGMVLNTFFRI